MTLPVVGYVFLTEATQAAIIFLIWNIVVGLSDNVLRPLMLGRGLEVPMPVILIGVIGGMLVDGPRPVRRTRAAGRRLCAVDGMGAANPVDGGPPSSMSA